MAGILYEKPEQIGEEAMNLHRTISSLIEELEAIDYYNQRIQLTKDGTLKKILIHNRDEEKEHAAMLIEHLRRIDIEFEKELKKFMFREEDITELEE